MKNILKLGFAAFSASALLSGCIQETFPTSTATKEQVASNPVALSAMVNGMAAYVNHIGTIDSDRHWDWGYPAIGLVRDLMCEDMSTVASGYEHFDAWIKNKNQGENYIYPQFMWNYYTQFLYTANSVIATVDEGSATETQLQYLAMAYCYRAMINLDMGRMYEFKENSYTTAQDLLGKTIPIIRENLTEDQARNNPRVDKAVLLEFIQEDLAKAIKYFGGDTKYSVFKRMSMAQPDLSVAYGLQARAYLWAEDYVHAKEAAQNALAAGNYTPLTEAQWTDTSTGFNSSSSNKSWMWASILVKEDDAVQTSLLNFSSWMASETAFGYASAGPFRLADVRFYNRIPNSDFRKKSWKAPEGVSLDVPMVAATATYKGEETVPEYANVKFRPGSGNPDDADPGAVCDYPLMRMEEMEFIISECDARDGNSATLVNFMKSYRNPDYVCTASGKDLVSEVIFQKRVEFWGEGIIFFDYKRLNMPVNRAYEGTNHVPDSRFDTKGSLAPWMNICIVLTEHNNNKAVISNPDPSDLVPDEME